MSKPTAAEIIDRLYLELSQFMTATTAKELALKAELEQVKAILAEHKNRENEPLRGCAMSKPTEADRLAEIRARHNLEGEAAVYSDWAMHKDRAELLTMIDARDKELEQVKGLGRKLCDDLLLRAGLSERVAPDGSKFVDVSYGIWAEFYDAIDGGNKE